MSNRYDTEAGPSYFPTTCWPEISLARDRVGERAREALAYLVERYWHPVYFFIRRKGRMREEAKDLAQEFFARFLEKDIVSYADEARGKFRTFLLCSVSRFLALEHRSAARRSKKIRLVEFQNDPDGWTGIEPTELETPEALFMQNWAKCFLESCVAKLRQECEARGRCTQFRVFRLRLLLEDPLPTRSVASQLGISEVDVVNYLHRAKERFRRIVRNEVARWVSSPVEVDQEIREIESLLSRPCHRRAGEMH